MSDKGSQWKAKVDNSRVLAGGWDQELPAGQTPPQPMDSSTPDLIPPWCVEITRFCVYTAAPVTGLGVFEIYVNGEGTGIVLALEDGDSGACLSDDLPISVPAGSLIEVWATTTEGWVPVQVRAVIEWQRCFVRPIGGPAACFDLEEDLELFDVYTSA